MLRRDPQIESDIAEWPTVEHAAEPDAGPTADTAQRLIATMLDAVHELQSLDWSELSPTELLATIRDLDVVARRQSAAMDMGVDRCDQSAAYCADGYRSPRPCLKQLGRISGGEAHRRVPTARALRLLPEVAEAYAAGRIPVESVRAIAKVASNPRVRDFLPTADPDFAAKASTMSYLEFVAWLKQWETLADADGAFRETDSGHERRNARMVRNDLDSTWQTDAHHGDAQGTAMADIFRAFMDAEFQADLEAARERLGEDVCLDQLPRTDAQRRADALFAIFVRAAAQPADANSPVPLVNIVIDDTTFEHAVRRACGQEVQDDPGRVDDVICHTIAGQTIHPSDAIAAALVGHVRRVVVDSDSNVINLGRKRRLFTGSSRDAVFLQRLIRDRGGTGCRWPGCDHHHRRLQADHLQAWRGHGCTNVSNGDLDCGPHNRLKESGFRPVRNPDGTWTIYRPDGTPITPSA